MICPACGKVNVNEIADCEKCGAPLMAFSNPFNLMNTEIISLGIDNPELERRRDGNI